MLYLSLWSARHNFFGEGNSLWLLDMGTSWYFSWKLNYFGIPKWKQGLFNIPQSGHESVYLLEPSFHSRTPNNSTFMKNISWCPCLKVRVNFLPRRNYAAHFTVLDIFEELLVSQNFWMLKKKFFNSSFCQSHVMTFSLTIPEWCWYARRPWRCPARSQTRWSNCRFH